VLRIIGSIRPTGALSEGAPAGLRRRVRDPAIPGRPVDPTFHLATPGAAYVLRKKPPGVLLPSAHAVDREFTVMRALAGTAVPVPKVLLLCTDESVIDRCSI